MTTQPSSPRMRGIQYAAASRSNHCRLWNTGSSAFADDDNCWRDSDFIHVIASAAKQSMSPRKGRMDCFASLAMTTNHTSAFPLRVRPGFANRFAQRRGRRECRVLAAPAVSRAKGTKESAHEHTGTVGASRHSPHNGFTAYAVLSLATNSSCHHHRRIDGLANPVGPAKTSADLTPATGAGTTRFCRTHQRRSSIAPVDRSQTEVRPAIPFAPDAAASTASHPDVSDGPDTPPRGG